MSRSGIRVHELLDFENFDHKMRANVARLQKVYGFEFDVNREIEYYRNLMGTLKPFIKDTHKYLNDEMAAGKNILLEGANGTLLDIDHGTYPYCTSSNASIGGISAGTGIAPNHFKSVIGIMKAYMTRVGAGPFPTELDDETGNKLRDNGGEYGSTTGRPRRCGWFDAVASKYSAVTNGLTSINLTKLDVLDNFETIKIAVAYKLNGEKIESLPASADILEKVEVEYIELPGWNQSTENAKSINDLPENAQKYVYKIEELLGVKIDFVGVGIKRDQMAIR